ncbi:2,3-bisphosphoglycerate-independent phosphoglycerate mutase [Candidatus Microgenomates bacterium]|nr:2,3-bisphosphoglycerate-independent phosphoglycerate mutase [Candidatus Microgenomates bacterium]
MKPTVLIVLDGWGMAPPGPGNAISQAKLPNFNRFWYSFPHTTLAASGEAVGLPRGEDGNSETGHLNLGAGRIVYQDLPRINMSIADGSFFKTPAFLKAIEHARKNNSHLHLIGLVGAGGVHSNMEHLLALLHLCNEQDFKRVFLHLFTDGRDSPPTSAQTYIFKIKTELQSLGFGEIATVSGRYYGMDRDHRWERTEKVYLALTKGIGNQSNSAETVLKNAYQKGITDEFILPTILVKNGKPIATIKNKDSVIFFNFRIDRPRQLTRAFVLDDFEKEAQQITFDPLAEKYYKKTMAVLPQATPPFKRGLKIADLFFTTMTEYEKKLPVSATAFSPIRIKMTLGEIFAIKNKRQLRISESEKERFVTYYFNGQREGPFTGEDRVIIASPKVATYDLKPEMSALKLTETLIAKINQRTYSFIFLNFPNPDMVGHTGNIQAAIKACEAVDACLGKIVPAILRHKGSCLITADHGNVEEMINLKTGGIDTEHSNNPVPFIIIDKKFENRPQDLKSGILADIAPTLLFLTGIRKPSIMMGRSLIT